MSRPASRPRMARPSPASRSCSRATAGPSGDRASATRSSRGCSNVGCTVLDIGIAPTPTCGFAVRHLNAAGGMQITASHNPAPWNGLKMFGGDGACFPPRPAQVRGLYESGGFTRASWDGTGSTQVPPDVPAEHARAVLDTVSVATVAGQGYRVFLDANGGAGGPLGSRLAPRLGCAVVQYECDPTATSRHEPEPIPANLTEVAPWVKQRNPPSASSSTRTPTGSRSSTRTGRYVGEELTLALAVQYRLRQERGPVVVNMSTSRVVEDIARAVRLPVATARRSARRTSSTGCARSGP